MVWKDKSRKGKYKQNIVYERGIIKGLSIFKTKHDEVILFTLIYLNCGPSYFIW